MALLLLLLAFLGATPRQYLHNLLADHEDADYGFRGKERAVGATVYQCGFHHQVATSPGYPEPMVGMAVPKAMVFARVFVSLNAHPVTGFGIPADGRGPPASLLV